MVSNKAAAISIVIGLLIGIELNRMYVPENFERPLRYKSFATSFRLISMTAKIGNTLGFGSEASILRSIIEKSSGFVSHKDDKVTLEDTKLSNIRVRIYKPISIKKEDKLPIMVFYHGGGYAFGSLNTYDYYLFELVKQLNMVIVSVDYRMSPENPYPIPTNDCFDVTKYVIEHPAEFNADETKLVLAGDSAGGNAAIIVSTRVAQENLAFKPKIQVLIYPWVQKFFTKLPSQVRYGETGILGEAKFGLSRFASWYLGLTNITQDLINVYRENEHLGMFDEKEQKRILSLLDTSKIPDKYKPDKAYYETQSNYQIPSKVPESSLLKRDPQVTELIRKLFEPKFSPLLATKEDLAILPKTYLQILEWDSLKDEALLYSERLKEAGVNTHVDFFENAFHGIASMTHGSYGYQIARDMQDSLIKYLKENL